MNTTNPESVAGVLHRCGGACERCGGRIKLYGWGPHHRRLKSQGRDDSITNLAGLCDGCHRWCHRFVADAVAAGWIVHSGDDPAEVPVELHWWRYVPGAVDGKVYLAPSGLYSGEVAA